MLSESYLASLDYMGHTELTIQIMMGGINTILISSKFGENVSGSNEIRISTEIIGIGWLIWHTWPFYNQITSSSATGVMY